MTSSSENTMIGAVIASPDSIRNGLPNQTAAAMAAALMWAAYQDEDQTKSPENFLEPAQSTWIFIEAVEIGASSVEEIGNVTIVRSALPELSLVIHNHESGDKSHSVKEEGDSEGFYFAFGSREYCQAVMHFLATGSDGWGKSWAFHFLRHLATAPVGEAAWTLLERKDGMLQFIHDEFTTIFMAARKAALAA